MEAQAREHAITHVVPEHLDGVRSRKLALLNKTEAAVKDRLTKEINYWDFRAEQLKEQERANRSNARLNSGEARKRADELQARLQKRMEEIKRERQLAPLPPVVLGGLLIAPHWSRPQQYPARRHQSTGPPSIPKPQRRGPARSSCGSSAALASSRSIAKPTSSAYDIESPHSLALAG